MGVTYWDGDFPDPAAGQLSYWGGNFPEGSYDPAFTPGVGPSGSATFALSILAGSRLTMSWETDIFKAYDGRELRAARTSLPKSHVQGSGFLVGNDVLIDRGVLARFAASGSVFLLGLAHESIPVTGSSGAVVNVNSTTLLDWLVAGGRAVVQSGNGATTVNAVIQSWTSNTITLDVSPGIGVGGVIMPAVAVYLDAQQGFQRYQTKVELWQIAARQIPFGFEQLERAAFASLSAATAGSFHNAIAVSQYTGSAGNGVSLQFVADGTGIGSVTVSGTAITYHFQNASSTVGDAQTVLAPYISFSGSVPGIFTTLTSANDVFGPVSLANGLDRIFGNMGVGATITTFDSRPVWDRPIQSDGTVADSLQTLADLVDLGGVPLQIGPALQPDWGRQVVLERLDRVEWQWLKAFLFTVRGMHKSWLLPTWRPDLTPVSLAPGVLKISSTIGDFNAWYSSQRTRVQVVLVDGSVGYCVITGAVDNGDGTASLSITTNLSGYGSGGGGSTLTNLQMVSWLDVCRFDSDTLEVTWDAGQRFSFSAQARAIKDTFGIVIGSGVDNEVSYELSQPREFVEVTHGATAYRWALGDRDITYNAQTFTATTSARAEINVVEATGEQQLTLSIPATHALARRYVAIGGVPPRQVLVTLRRQQLGTGAVEQLWTGYVTSLAFNGHLANLTVPERMQRSLARRLPTIVNATKCQAVLYDGQCKVTKATFTVSGTASPVDGRSVTVPALTGKPDHWAKDGRLVHVASGESVLIGDQVGVVLALQSPIYDLKAGDAVQVIAGCKKDIPDCRDKFSNVYNFIGLPNAPTKNPFFPTGTGAGEGG